ncbi:MAG TPA: hypothetical protein ACFYD3_02100 [Candidatus Hypogeohydataceae bacterium YC41]
MIEPLSPPTLSVIIASTALLRQMPACLLDILKQCHGRQVEIILVYSSDSDLQEAIVADDSHVILIRLPPETALPCLIGTAFARTKGEIIAITDTTCGVDEHWIAAILDAHKAPHPIIGGAVEPDKLKRLVDWTAYFCDYGQFMLPLASRTMQAVPGNNISIKRWILEKGKEFVEGEFWKTYWCRRIQMEGFSLYAVPSIIVFYRKSFQLWPYLVHRFHNGRCFAGMRLAQLSQVDRLVYVLGSPFLPILFCARILKVVLPKRRYLGRFFLAFPLIILATMSWAFGEFVGYLLGSGTSCHRVR